MGDPAVPSKLVANSDHTAANTSPGSLPALPFRPMFNDEDRAILDFERSWWRQPGPKDQAIEMVLGLSAYDYYERLLAIIGLPSASAYDPLTTKRVMRLIDSPSSTELAV